MTPNTFEAAIQAPLHPALRWTPWAGNNPAQHARTRDGNTRCGLPGPLTLADGQAEFCPACYPTRVAA